MSANPTITLAGIANAGIANGCQRPGHADHLTKEAMATRAQSILTEYGDILEVAHNPTGASVKSVIAFLKLSKIVQDHGRYWQGDGVSENLGGLVPKETAESALQYADALITAMK